MTLKIVEFELKRHQLRLEEERGLEAAAASAPPNSDASAQLDRERKRNKKRLRKQDQLLSVVLSVAVVVITRGLCSLTGPVVLANEQVCLHQRAAQPGRGHPHGAQDGQAQDRRLPCQGSSSPVRLPPSNSLIGDSPTRVLWPSRCWTACRPSS